MIRDPMGEPPSIEITVNTDRLKRELAAVRRFSVKLTAAVDELATTLTAIEKEEPRDA